MIFRVEDCRRTYEELVAKGVEFTQEPTEHFYGVDCGLRDPFGNPLRLTQPAPGPIEIPSPASRRRRSESVGGSASRACVGDRGGPRVRAP